MRIWKEDTRGVAEKGILKKGEGGCEREQANKERVSGRRRRSWDDEGGYRRRTTREEKEEKEEVNKRISPSEDVDGGIRGEDRGRRRGGRGGRRGAFLKRKRCLEREGEDEERTHTIFPCTGA